MAVNFSLRYWELWDLLRTRLNADPTIFEILGGPRVYEANQNYSAPEADEDTPWGRIVLVPATAGWPAQFEIGKRTEVEFLVRTEMNDFQRPDYDVSRPLDALQDATFRSLDHFIPTVRGDNTPLRFFVTGLPLWCADWAQPQPILDEARGIWWKSSRWSTELAAVVS